ncbi:T-cell surface glycoprotein CD8 alpha chain [Danio aesculapii]|uniref:T-cell surface glycoprotein CD8 alpha chain n=1 Tax=Danio aesculapii TaxID=1142201 RepID=UPI0024BFDB10|nr:T-cell surface glycoprotein CD8 alpha chain [Danio aesculapii]
MLVLVTEEMYQTSIGFCVILSLFYGYSAEIYQENSIAEVNCNPKTSGTMTFMFHISSTGANCILIAKQTDVKYKADPEKYSGRIDSNGNLNVKIKSFAKRTDSGVYTCATMNNNKLFFGEVTTIQGVPDPVTQGPKIIQSTLKPVVETTTKTQCPCENGGVNFLTAPKPMFNCETWIFTSLAGGCALFLILLIATIVYCNRLRTRRCPHHYKRQPRGPPAGLAKMPNSHF